MSTTEDLIKERSEHYQDAWRMTGTILEPVAHSIANLHVVFPQAWYSWVMIMNKAIRLLADPRHLDSWRDIAGYATLVVNHLEKESSHADRG